MSELKGFDNYDLDHFHVENIKNIATISTKVPNLFSSEVKNTSFHKDKSIHLQTSFHLYAIQIVDKIGDVHKIGFLTEEMVPKELLNDDLIYIRLFNLSRELYSQLLEWHLYMFNILLHDNYKHKPKPNPNLWFDSGKHYVLCPLTDLLDINVKIIASSSVPLDFKQCNENTVVFIPNSSSFTFYRFIAYDEDSKSLILQYVHVNPSKDCVDDENLVSFDSDTPFVMFEIPFNYFSSIRRACIMIQKLERKLVCFEFLTEYLRLSPQIKIDWLLLDIALSAVTGGGDNVHDGDRLCSVGSAAYKMIVSDYVFNINYKNNVDNMSKHRRFIIQQGKSKMDFKNWLQYILKPSIGKFIHYDPPGFVPNEQEPLKVSLFVILRIFFKINAVFYLAHDRNSMVKFIIDCGFKIRDQKLTTLLIEPKIQMDSLAISKVEKIIGYEFKDKNIISNALTHASFDINTRIVFDQLEYLGDSVLEVVAISKLYEQFNHLTTGGDLVFNKQKLVNNKTLAYICIKHGIYKYFRSNDNQKSIIDKYLDVGGKEPKLLADMMEALVGAIYLDSDRGTHPVLQMIVKLVTISSDYSKSSARIKIRV